MRPSAWMWALALAAGCGSVASGTAGAPSGGASAEAIQTVYLGKKGNAAQPAPAIPGQNVPAIKVDTVGYPTGWTKMAVFNVEPTAAVVKEADSGKVVLKIDPAWAKARGVDAASQDPVWQVDFSELNAPGRYVLANGTHQSDPFEISEDPYGTALLAGLKSFYFQRTRTALEKPYAVWEGDAYTRRTASHTHENVGWDLEDYPAKKRKWAVEGGWHDAGNFDMYVPSTAPSAQALLMAYEWSPQRFDDRALNTPESGNGTPDILDEARWGLVWVLSLQQEDGAFRHREAVMQWTPEGPADEDKTARWVAGVSSSATAKAVAVLAQASRVYAPFDRAFAKRCEQAAKQGFEWLLTNPEHVRVDGKGSPQPKWDDEPEHNDVGARFTAAAEVWHAFRDKRALPVARALLKHEMAAPKELITGAWANLSRWAVATLALDAKTPDDLRSRCKARILEAADLMREQVEKRDGYRCASTPADYYWAHNSNLMEKAHVLAVAGKLAPELQWHMQAVRDQWHWVMGRNPNGFSMVTRVGKGPTRLYHMEWGPMEPPPPGFLIGGPNHQNLGFLAPDAPAKALLWDNPKPLRSGLPAHSLWHWRQSDLWDAGWVEEGQWSEGWWAVIEPDILYSANLVLVAAVL